MTTITAPQALSEPAPTRLANLGRGLRIALRRLPDFLVNVFLQRRVIGRPYGGVMHLLIFWGVTIQVIGTAINLMQMKLFTPFELATFPRGPVYFGYEAIMDLAGVAILVGVAMALVRRLVLRPKAMPSRWDDYFALVLLGIIPLAGFTVEATRMVTFPTEWARWSPIGSWLAGVLRDLGVTPEAAAWWHTPLFWGHAALGLTLLVSLPFTKMRHTVMMPLNVAVRSRRRSSALATIHDIENAEALGVGTVNEFAPSQLLQFDACVRCGRCEEACPVNACDAAFSPRTLIQNMRSALVDDLVEAGDTAPRTLMGAAVPEDKPWQCTTCGACIAACPGFINPPDALIDLRRYQVMTTGEVPRAVGDTLRNFERQSNPWGLPADDRAVRVKALGVRTVAPGEQVDTLLYLGCAFTYDDRNGKAARALIDVLTRSGVDFGVLGEGELCCGESARRMGHEYMFQEMARANIERLGAVRFRRIVTACPHCYNTFKQEYPDLGAHFEVRHHTEVLAELGRGSNGHAKPAPAVSGRVAYHDSCYLGRYNGLYADPRAVLDQAGVERVELPKHGADSFCCGGGGGQMWMEIEPEHRLNLRRLDEAVAAGADVVATACPYCLLMFDDAIRTRGLSDQVRVMDVAEVLAAGAAQGATPARDDRSGAEV